MSSLFLVLQFVLAVIITIAVLLQKSSSIGLGAYSGSNESLFGAKGPAGFLAKFTFVVAVIFVLNTLMLGYSYNKEMKRSLIDSANIQSIVPKAKDSAVPTAPDAK
ncbi:preprotein translocase subunit SecG [Campylobacter mucosalis]|uniref:Protein-export membrane protein SecG n=1 Tax=Campylobacter mucosalis CCUG 21559 TaxID=1032067 RepID=A0A6G5QJ77_9BACT|nr:preprotein translocase subunit SecG [Campylobacter mucosalis]KEA45395.1 preprotein translocase subunit SecG [Campylobacter mucosalis]QCD45637.1 preprotein translocase SecYEG, SecG subunit [Campylobacter mucosalis CCUG 21559]QKF63827.1 preprotein translocase SecYEG, SecG subunit [Campylobacter mucosalis]